MREVSVKNCLGVVDLAIRIFCGTSLLLWFYLQEAVESDLSEEVYAGKSYMFLVCLFSYTHKIHLFLIVLDQ